MIPYEISRKKNNETVFERKSMITFFCIVQDIGTHSQSKSRFVLLTIDKMQRVYKELSRVV